MWMTMAIENFSHPIDWIGNIERYYSLTPCVFAIFQILTSDVVHAASHFKLPSTSKTEISNGWVYKRKFHDFPGAESCIHFILQLIVWYANIRARRRTEKFVIKQNVSLVASIRFFLYRFIPEDVENQQNCRCDYISDEWREWTLSVPSIYEIMMNWSSYRSRCVFLSVALDFLLNHAADISFKWLHVSAL